MSKSIFITGCAGFIGSHFLKYIFDNTDWKIFGLDSLTYAGNPENIPDYIFDSDRFKFIYGDIRDIYLAQKYMSQCEYCVHFAASTHVSKSIYNTNDFIDVDVKGTQVLLDVLKQHKLERFIHISTSEVYGTAQHSPMTELHPLNPRSPYAASKCGADRLCFSYITTFDLPITIIRPFNNYGSNQHPEKLIPHLITSILQGKKGKIFGSGEAQRDWLYVEDTIEGIFKALTTKSANQKIINLATNRSISVNEIANMIIKEIGGEIEYTDFRPGEVSKHEGSYEGARLLLNWVPKVNIETGIKLTIEWYKNNENWWNNRRTRLGCQIT